MEWKIYKIFENESGRVIYIGQTFRGEEARYNEHFKKDPERNKNTPGHGKFFGRQNELTMQVIEAGIATRKQAIRREEYWQKFYELETDMSKKILGANSTNEWVNSLSPSARESYLKNKAAKGVNTFFSKGEDHVSSWKSQISETLKNKQPFACACGKMLKAQGRHKCK